MKNSRHVLTLSIALTCIYFVIAGCKKKDDTTPENPANNTTTPAPIDSTHQTTRSTDATDLQNQSNNAMDDVNSAIGDVAIIRDVQTICGATVDTTNLYTTGQFSINYNGAPCNAGTVQRNGQIRVQMSMQGGHPQHFSTQGASATLTFDNFKVTNLSTNHSITYNGTLKMKNKNQGGLTELYLYGTPIEHKIRANIQVAYDDGTNALWNAAEIRKVTYDSGSGILKDSLKSDTSTTDYPHLLFWGKNRFNENYFVDAEQAFSYDLVNNNSCILKPLSGIFHLYWSTYEITLTYGINESGTQVSPPDCPWGYKFNWEYQGTSAEIKIHY